MSDDNEVHRADAEQDGEALPPVTVDQSQVVETLQRKFAMLVAQLTYENATLETALLNARGDIGALRAKNEALMRELKDA